MRNTELNAKVQRILHDSTKIDKNAPLETKELEELNDKSDFELVDRAYKTALKKCIEIMEDPNSPAPIVMQSISICARLKKLCYVGKEAFSIPDVETVVADQMSKEDILRFLKAEPGSERKIELETNR